jgi:hypothetical protein
VFDKTFKAGEKFSEPDLVNVGRHVSLLRRERLPLHGPGDLRDADARGAPSATTDCCWWTTCWCSCRSTTASDAAAVSAARRVDRDLHRTGVRGDTRAAASRSLPRSKPASRSAFLSSSRKAEKVKVHTRRASSPVGRDPPPVRSLETRQLTRTPPITARARADRSRLRRDSRRGCTGNSK